MLIAVGYDDGRLGADFLDKAVQDVGSFALRCGFGCVLAVVIPHQLAIVEDDPAAGILGF